MMTHQKRALFICLIAGALLTLSFAPFHWFFMGFIAPAVLLWSWRHATPAQAFWRGLAFGLAEFGVATSWIYVSIHNFGNASGFLAGLITVAFVILMALYPATQGYVFAKLFRRHSAIVQCFLAFPATWVIWEGLRSHLMTGFPWILLGYSQTDTVLNGYAPVLSVYGVSLATILISGALVFIARRSSFRAKLSAAIVALAIIIIAIPLHLHHWTTSSKKPISVALVQGNIPQSLKWNPQQLIHTVKKYTAMTSPYLNHQLIVWPEAAVPILASQAKPLLDKISQTAKQHRATLIFGIPTSNPNYTKYYNAIMAVGQGHGVYLKRHLVPFGEYTPLGFIFDPLMKHFQIPMSDLSKGPAKQKHLYGQGYTIAPSICYEIAYPFLVIGYSNHANLLVTINDDSWFGRSLASAQQVQIAQMRSLETQRYMLYSSNTGVTAIIAPNGEILHRAPKNKPFVLTGEIKAITGSTPVMVAGYYPMLIILAVMLLIALFSRRRN